MKPLTKATQKLFEPLVQSIPSYTLDKFKNERLELVTNDDDITVMDIYSIRPNDKNKYEPQTSAAMRFPERLFEKHHMKENKWKVPLTDSNVELIWDTWPKNQIVFNHKAKDVFIKTLALGIRQELNAQIVAKYKLKGELGQVQATEKSGAELINYQKVARHCALKSEQYALFMEQGTGKTPVAISTVVNDYLKTTPRIYRCLIMCPKGIRFNWQNELEHFCPVPYRATIIKGTKVQREMQLIEAIVPDKDMGPHISFVIASYGALINTENAFCFESVAGIQLAEGIKWDTTIIDEAHALKSPNAKRTKISHRLREASKRRLVLTGTPFVNSLFDLWGMWEFLDKHMSGFSNFHAFRDFHAVYEKTSNGRQKLVDFDHVPLLQERLARTSFMITKKEALPELPEKSYDIVTCSMSQEQCDIYNRVAQQLYVEIENELNQAENKELTINNVLTKLLRLAQITAGFVVWDEKFTEDGEELSGKQIDRFDPNNKLETLIELVKENEDKTIIWSNFVPAIKFIHDRMEIEGIDSVLFYGKTKDDDRQDAVNRFNRDRNCKVFVGNPAAGGVGLNLLGYDYENKGGATDTVCNHEIYYSQNWSLTARAQSEDRAHRKGTKSNVRITDLLVPDTIDVEIRRRVLSKIQTSLKLQDVRHILSKIINPVEIEVGEE